MGIEHDTTQHLSSFPATTSAQLSVSNATSTQSTSNTTVQSGSSAQVTLSKQHVIIQLMQSSISQALYNTLSVRYSELADATENFSPSYVIGKGGYGVVYKGHWKHTIIAVKRIVAKRKDTVKHRFLTSFSFPSVRRTRARSLAPVVDGIAGIGFVQTRQYSRSVRLLSRRARSMHYLPVHGGRLARRSSVGKSTHASKQQMNKMLFIGATRRSAHLGATL